MPNTVMSEGSTRGESQSTRRSCAEMGVEALGNAVTNQTRGARRKVEV